MREANIENLGVQIRGKRIANLRFADDTVLLENNEQRISELVEKVNTAGSNRQLGMNAKKTKSMTIGRNMATINVGTDTVEDVNKYKYLGSIKTSDGNSMMDVKTRIGMAKTKTIELVNIWNDRSIPKTLKVKLVKILIWPVLMYGCEGWVIKKKVEKHIEAAEMWIYRRVLRISWQERRTNNSILEELKLKRELLNKIKERKLKFEGHQLRLKKSELFNTIFQSAPQKRNRGRPRIGWKTDIQKWTGKKLTEITRMADDRKKWKNLVHGICRQSSNNGGSG